MDYKRRLSRNSAVLEEARVLLKAHGIKYRFCWNSSGSFCYPLDRYVQLGLRTPQSVQLFLSELFHEIAHIVAFDRKKFVKYHASGRRTRMTKSLYQNWIRTGLRAERYVDRLGSTLMAQYYPDVPFIAAYSNDTFLGQWRERYFDDWKKALK